MTNIDLPSDRQVDKAIPERERAPETKHKVARIWIPAVLVVAGVVLLIAGAELVAIVAFLAAVIAAVADRLIRLGIVSQRDRDREAARRQEMRRSGRWK